MEAAISCKFHCKRLAEHWLGYWPATDPGELAADTASEGTRIRASAEAQEVSDPGWAAALRRMAAAVG